uniref:Tetratricopeptide repeat protein n=1 Tax=candidate division WOR-3 bacterium TaxID=2052148 RepID=A0A7C4GHB1_UNCW3
MDTTGTFGETRATDSADTTRLLSERVAAVSAEVAQHLERSAAYYPADLPPDHYARLTGWQPVVYGSQSRIHINPFQRFSELTPLQRHIESVRAHAEALLVHERLDQIIIGLEERQELTRRALGILPGTEELRLQEVCSCPELRPRLTATSAVALVQAMHDIQAEYGPATALEYGLLVAGGFRARQEFAIAGRKIDNLFNRIASAPSVIQGLDQVATARPGTEFETKFRLLLAVREQLWRLKPGRLAPDGFLLAKVVDAYLGPRPSVGNALGLAVVDTVIIGKLGFEVRWLIESGIIRLEVLIENRGVYWEPTEPSPLSFVPVVAGRPLTVDGILALTYSSIAFACFTRGLWDKAIENYSRALELEPESDAIHASIGVCHLRRGAPDAAVKALEQAVRIAPSSAAAWHSLGNARAMARQWPRAIDAYKRALRCQPDLVEAMYNMGLAFQSAGQPEQARAAFEAAIEIRPGYCPAHVALGNLHLETGRQDEAVRCYREAARLEPSDATAHYNLGRAYYERGQLDNAIHSYQRAVQLNPKHAGAWHNLGICYRDKGQKEKAVEALEQAVRLNPNLMR